MAAPPVFGRYHVIEILGAGSHGRVLKVDDLEVGEVRALKVILDDARAYRLFKNFNDFAAISHRHLVPLYDVGQDPTGISYVSTALVEGGTVATLSSPLPPVEVCLRWLREALSALKAYHEGGLVHGNIKPSNVFLELGTEPGKRSVRLGDAGLPVDTAAARDPQALVWIAPECLDGGSPGIRSDLYSTAAVFYLSITGCLPFTGSAPDALKRQKRGGNIAPPSTLRPELPAEVDTMLLAMLAADPAARPASAQVVIQALDELESGPVVDDDPSERLHLPLVGRDKALAALDEAVDGLAQGRGQLLVFTGGPGSGKSRLLKELTLRLRKAGATIHDAGPLPPRDLWRPLRRLLRGAVLDEGDRWDKAIIRHRAALKPLFHEALPGPEPTQPLGSVDWRGRGTPHHLAAADAVASFLIEVSEEPRAVLVDEAHLAPNSLQRVVGQLAQRLSEAPLLVALTLDPAGLPEGAPLSVALGERTVARVELADLSRSQLMQLLEGVVGDVRWLGDLVDEVERWSGGTPLGVELALQRAVSQEALVPTRNGWRLNAVALSRALAPHGGTAARWDGGRWEGARLQGLSSDDRPCLQVLATLERATASMIAAALGGGSYDADAVQRLLQRNAKAEVVSRDEENGTWRIPRASIAAALKAEADRVSRRLWHRRAADHLSSQGRPQVPPHWLAAHWIEGGEDLKALGPGLLALDDLEASWRFESALNLAARLLSLDGLSAEGAFDLRARAAQLALREGHTEKARRLAAPLVDQRLAAELPTRQWRANWLMGRICLASGAYDEARSRIEAATTWVPEDAAAADRIALTTAHVVVRMLTGRPEVAEGVAEGLLEGAISPGDVDTARCHIRLWAVRTTVAWNRGRPGDAEAHAIEGFRVAETFGLRFPEAAAALRAEMASLALMRARACYSQARYGDTRQSAGEALTRFREVHDLVNMARCHELMGLTYAAGGETGPGIEHFEEMRGLAHRALALTELGSAAMNLGSLYRVVGRLERAQEVLEEGIVAARSQHNKRLLGTLLGSLGEVWHKRGELERARGLYEDAVEALKFSSRAELLENIRRLLELTFEENNLHGFEMKVAEALTLARSHSRKVEEGNLLGLLGTYAARMGRSREATSHFRAGEEALRAAGAHYDLGKLKLRQGRVYMDLGAQAEAEAALRMAEDSFRRLGAEPDLRIAQEALKLLEENAQGSALVQKKLELLLQVNRSLNSILDLEELLDVIVDRALEFTHSERGFVILFDESGRRTLHASRHMDRREVAGANSEVSSTVLRRVRDTMAPVTVTHIDQDSELRSTRSVVSQGLNAILAAPLKRGDRLMGVLYLDSSRPVQEFYRRDQGLLEALADAAAIAVENAQLVTSLRRKTELMSILAHEFRRPLTATRLFVGQLLRRADQLDAHDREALEGIGHQGDRLNRMIENILELSRMEADKVDWRFESVAVAHILRSTVIGLQPIADEAGVRVSYEVNRVGLTTFGSEDRLIQVCTNLLANALRYTERDGLIAFTTRIVPAEVAAEADGEGRDRWKLQSVPPGWRRVEDRRIEVSISDDGPGIPEADLDEIFDRFRQSSAPRGQGTGLGLTISRDIVANHGGRMWAENRPEGGARFRFTLPLLEAVEG